jgi:hypothetical protein
VGEAAVSLERPGICTEICVSYMRWFSCLFGISGRMTFSTSEDTFFGVAKGAISLNNLSR